MKLAALFLSNQNTSAALDAMLNAQRVREWHTPIRLTCTGGAAGYVHTSDQFASVELTKTSGTGNWLAISGLPIDLQGSLDVRLRECLSLPLEAALRQLTQLDGAFAALYWDNSVRKMGIVTDILGMQPLHLCRRDGLFAVASDIRALAAARLIDVEIDPASWGAFLSMRHTIAGRTLMKDVERVSPGSVLVYEPASDTLKSEGYWNWPMPAAFSRLEELPVAQLVDVFLAELRAYQKHNSAAKLCLSGGFDSRLILAGLAQIGTTPETLSLSHADEMFDMDARIARRLARVFRAPFRLHQSDRSFFSSAQYLDYLIATEVATPSLYLFIAQLCSTLHSSMRAVWEGVFPGCILFPIHQPPGDFDSYLRRECAPLDSPAWKAAGQVFRPDLVQQMREAFSECLNDEKNRYTDDEFGVSQFVVRNRTRHRIAINPLQVYSNDVLVLTPGMSKQFWSLSAGIPYHLRAEHRLYQYIFRKFFPKATSIPALSGSALYPLDTTADAELLLSRLGRVAMRRPKVAAALRLVGLRHEPEFWRPSKLVDAALEEFDTCHPDISAAGLAEIKSAQPPYSPTVMKARELLFYWIYWRRMMSGELLSTVSTGSARPDRPATPESDR